GSRSSTSSTTTGFFVSYRTAAVTRMARSFSSASNLAARCPGNRIDDRELDRHLVGRQHSGAMGLQGVEVPRVHDDLGARHLATPRVGPAEPALFFAARDLVDALLLSPGKNLEPAHEDAGLLPPLKGRAARLVQEAEVAREEPAVAHDLLAAP